MGKPSRFPQAQTSSAQVRQITKPPVAPPVYRPQPIPKVLQRKAVVKQAPVGQAKPAPLSPPVYHPQPTPKVLQRKQVDPQHSTSRSPRKPAPRLQANATMSQPQPGGGVQRTPVAPTTHRPPREAGILQRKKTVDVTLGPAAGKLRNESVPLMRNVARVHRVSPATGRVVQRLIVNADSDHEERARQMSEAVGENFGFLDELKDLTECTTDADTTLTIWGHGDNSRLGGRSYAELALELRNKKLADTNIKTIELLSCNPSISENEDLMSYAEAVAKAGSMVWKRPITVKTFPAATGKVSLLWYFNRIKEFVYFQAGNEQLLVDLERELKQLGEWDGQMLRKLLPEHLELWHKKKGITYLRGPISTIRTMLVPVSAPVDK